VVLRQSNYTAPVDGTLTAGGVTVKGVGNRSPSQNAYVERFVQEIKRSASTDTSCSGGSTWT
jgi:hypothetical protein